MINPSVETVLDFEGNVEKCVADALTELGFAAYPSDHDGDLPMPRVEVVATVTDAGPHEAPLAVGRFGGDMVYDQQRLNVTVKYYFAPESAGEFSSVVRKFRGAFRRLVFYSSKIVERVDDQQLYRAAHASVRETGGIRGVETEEDCWSLESSIDLVIFIAMDRAVNSVVVSGAGTDVVNGYYALRGDIEGKPRYRSESHRITWSGTEWQIRGLNSSTVLYRSEDDTDFPWQAGTWIDEAGDTPVPTLDQGTIRSLLGFAPPPEWY